MRSSYVQVTFFVNIIGTPLHLTPGKVDAAPWWIVWCHGFAAAVFLAAKSKTNDRAA